MKNKFLKNVISLSVATFACAAFLAGNVPAPGNVGNDVVIEDLEDEENEPGISPMSDDAPLNTNPGIKN